MRLRIVTPVYVVVDESDVIAVRGEDSTGAFGILPGHTDFLTVLSVSVISWETESGKEGHAAVRGGVFEVSDGDTVSVATREAVVGASLTTLRDEVLARFKEDTAFNEMSKTSSAKLNLALIRQLQKYLEAGRAAGDGSSRGAESLGTGSESS